METFSPPKEFVEDPGFTQARSTALSKLDLANVDHPIVDLIFEFAALPHCFTVQSCHGHFLCRSDDAPDNNTPIPRSHAGGVRYRIAYIALCIEHSDRGRALRNALSAVPRIDQEYVQFGSPVWFWDQRVNSYALQVEPAAQQFSDEAQLDVDEARQVERIRDLFFHKLRALVVSEARESGAG